MPEWFTQFPSEISINIKDVIDQAIQYMLVNWNAFFDGLTVILRALLNAIGSVVNNVPWWLLILIVFLLTLKSTHRIIPAVLYSVLLVFVGAMGLWTLMNLTITTVITSVIISLIIGLPIGILISFNKRLDAFVRPILDTM